MSSYTDGEAREKQIEGGRDGQAKGLSSHITAAPFLPFTLGAIYREELQEMGLSSYLYSDVAMMVRDSIRNQWSPQP